MVVSRRYRKNQDRKKHVKFGQMWRFRSLDSSIAMAWCIMNSCHKVVWSIRNTILKLCADCAKQFVRNAQNCGKTNQEFCGMLTVFFDCNGLVHHVFLPQGRMVNKEYYLEGMRRLREAIRRKRTELWKNQSWILNHDNAPMLVRDFLAKNKTIIMPNHRTWLLLTISSSQNWRHWWKESGLLRLRTIETGAVGDSAFRKCFEDWKKR